MPTQPTGPTQVAEVVVNGRRIYFEFPMPTWVPPLEPPPLTHETIEPVDTETYPCQVISGLSDAEKFRYLVRFALAVWREQRLADPVQNREYGSYFYLDGTGEIKWTPVSLSSNQTAFLDQSALPTLPNGMPDWSRVILIAHTHPRYNLDGQGNTVDYFDPADPTRLQQPSQPYVDNGGHTMAGDWAAFDSVIANAIYQQTYYGAAGPRADLSLAIVGSDGNQLRINQYFAEDKNQSGARNPVSTQPFPPCSS